MTRSATLKSGSHLNQRGKPAANNGVSRNQFLLVGAAVVLALGAAIIAAMPDTTVRNAPGTAVSMEARAAGVLSARETGFDFGSISMAAGKVTHNYRFRNTSSTPVAITQLYTSCMCTTAALVKGGRKSAPHGMPGHGFMPSINESIGPNEEAMIEVVFDPAAHGPAGIGPIERVVTVENSAGRPLELAFSARVRP